MNNDNNLEFCIAGVNCRAGYATECNNNEYLESHFAETPTHRICKEKSLAAASFNTADFTFSDIFQGKQKFLVAGCNSTNGNVFNNIPQ